MIIFWKELSFSFSSGGYSKQSGVAESKRALKVSMLSLKSFLSSPLKHVRLLALRISPQAFSGSQAPGELSSFSPI
jgi:hypothetical protein